MITPEPTPLPEGWGEIDNNIIEDLQENADTPIFRTVFTVIVIILALISGMVLYSYADRHLRYQQYSKRQKSSKPRHK